MRLFIMEDSLKVWLIFNISHLNEAEQKYTSGVPPNKDFVASEALWSELVISKVQKMKH